jgi:integrase
MVAKSKGRTKRSEEPEEPKTRIRRDWGGSIYVRPDRPGTLWARWKDSTGKTCVRNTGTADKVEAERFLAIETGKVAADEERGVRAVTVKAFWEDEVESVFKSRLSERQFDGVKNQVLRAAGSFGDVPMYRVDKAAAEAFFATIRKEGVRGAAAPGKPAGTGPLRDLSVSTLTRYRAALAKLWSAAIDRGAATTNPFRAVTLGRPVEKAATFLTAADVRNLYLHTPPSVRPFIVFLGESGARFGEAIDLRWSQVADDYSGVTFARTKSGRIRVVPLTPTCADILKTLHKRRVAPMSGEDRVFALDGNSHSYILRQFRAALAGAGLPAATRLHDLRHSFASQLVQAGVALSVVSSLLGHSSLVVTSRYASHAPASLGAQAVQLLAQVRAEDKARGRAKARTRKSSKRKAG